MGSLVSKISSWRGEDSIIDLAYRNNKIYAISNNYLSISNIEKTEWASVISISSAFPRIITFSNEIYITNINSYNYDLWKLNSTEDGLDFVCSGNDIDYRAKNFIIHNTNLFAIVNGVDGRLVKFNGLSWDIVGTIINNLTDGISFNGILCVTDTSGQLYVWDGNNTLIQWGSSCPEIVSKLCVHNNVLYGGTTLGNLYLFDTLTETWSLVCSSSYSLEISDLVSYRGYIYAGIANYYSNSFFVRNNGSTWEDVIPYKDYYFGGLICFLNESDNIYIGANLSGTLYRYVSFTVETLDFEANKLYDVAPAVISFTSNVESDFPFSYLWDFEDGIFSSDANPIHIFIRGTYDISLTVDDGIEVITITKENYIDSYTTEVINISTIEELQQIGSPGDAIAGIPGFSLRNNYLQVSNIDASSTQFWNGGKGFLPIGRPVNTLSFYNTFCGSYDGNNYYIDGLYISNNSYLGLFGYVGNASIRNINLFNTVIMCNMSDYCGAIVGFQYSTGSCIIENCYVTGTINLVLYGGGGIIGRATKININNCYTDVTIIGNTACGGIVGVLDEEGAIVDCETYGEIEYNNCGGVIGFNNGILDLENCNSNVVLTGDYIGGIIGYSSGNININNCSYTSTITGSFGIGGILGYGSLYNIIIDNCIFSGTINIAGSWNSEIGGIIGFLDSSTSTSKISNCIANGLISSVNDYIGFLGGIGGQVSVYRLENCSSTVVFDFEYLYNYAIGGLVGYFSRIEELYNCNFIGTVEKGTYIGGISSNIQGSYPIVRDCYSISDIISNQSSFCGGLFADFTSGGEIVNCYYEGSIFIYESGSYIGGLVGNGDCLIENCYTIGEINLEGYCGQIGGICGFSGGAITNCYTIMNISILYGELYYIGGIVGYALNSLQNVFYVGNLLVAVEKRNDTYTGGLVGYYNSNNITQKCYTIGTIITTTEFVGGLIGVVRYATSSIIKECFSLMNIQSEGGIIGGLIGSSVARVEDCFNKGNIVCFKDVNRNNIIGGLIGKMYDPAEVHRSYNSGLVRLVE